MSSFKRNIVTLILLGIVYLWFLIFNVNTKPAVLQIPSANSGTILFTQPESGRQPILDVINNAKSEVLVEVYLMSDKQVIQALTQAKQRGLNVEVMLEEHPFGGGNLNNKTKQTLSDAGVLVAWTNSSFALTHEKSIIIDKSEVIILNQNLTTSSFTKNREYDIIDTNKEDVLEARTVFTNDWERKSFTSTSSHLIISPNTSRPALTTLIVNAKKTIDIEIEDINDSKIVYLLSEKAKTMQVRLIVPTFSQIKSNSGAVKELAKNGVFVKTLSSPYIHAKLILVDNLKAYVGSINLSTQSLDENRELGIMLSESQNIQTLASTFETDWIRGKQLTGQY